MWVYGFRFYFTPLAGVLFAFPSRYFCTIGRISYLALDRGRPGFRQGFSCPAVLRYRLTETSLCRVRGFHPLCQAFPKPFRYTEVFSNSAAFDAPAALQPRPIGRFRLLRFRSPLLPESRLFSFPRVLRWFSSPSPASSAYLFSGRMPASRQTGYPIRLSADHRMCAPPRGFSQLATAFFASIRQGIRRKPFLA